MADVPDDDDNEVSQIPLQVPVGRALDNLESPSDISWTMFCIMVSNQMDIPESKLNIAYKLSIEPKSDLPHCLSTVKHLLQLITTADQHLLGAIKSCSKKPFSIIIVDKSPKDTGKKNGNKGNSKVSSAPTWPKCISKKHSRHQSIRRRTVMKRWRMVIQKQSQHSCQTGRW